MCVLSSMLLLYFTQILARSTVASVHFFGIRVLDKYAFMFDVHVFKDSLQGETIVIAGRSGRQEGYCEAMLQTGKPLTSRQLQFRGTIRSLAQKPTPRMGALSLLDLFGYQFG